MTDLLENALIEELLQLLVAVVDAELLKTVVLKVLWGGGGGEEQSDTVLLQNGHQAFPFLNHSFQK